MSSPAFGGRTPLVLIVDDQAANLRLLGKVLSDAGFDVMPAASGEQALARIKAALPDVILLDMRMPGMDGFDVLVRLKSNPDWADLPVLFLTAAHERELLVRALEGGAVDYLTKPFVAEELVARVRTHAELKRSRDQLRIAIGEREDLAAIIVHDLKNPLFNISLNAALLRESLDGDAELGPPVRSIEQSSRTAMEFVERYLARCAGSELRPDYRPQAMAVDALFARALDEFREQAARSDHQLPPPPPSGLHVACDPDDALTILRNLLSNALKYSPSGSQVSLTAGATPHGMVRLAVADQGPGISAQDRNRLFRRYVRLSAEAAPGPQSSGVGLALSRQLAERMGGELWHEQRHGGGAVFVLGLPLAVGEGESIE